MKLGYTLLIAFAGLWVLSIFFGYIKGLSKTFSNAPSAVDSSSIKDQEEKTIQDTKDKQQQMMDDIKQKMRDTNQKY